MRSHGHVAFYNICIYILIVNVHVIWDVIAAARIEPAYELTTEYLPSKYSFSLETSPRFSWKIPILPGLDNRGVDQAAYRLVVSHAYGDERIIWDSGIAESNASTLVEYAGPALEADSSYQWTVQWFRVESLRSMSGYRQLIPSAVSEVSYFDVGLVSDPDWSSAKWIGGERHRLIRVTVPAKGGQISRARVHVSAPGCVIVSVNGKKHSQSSNGICPWTSFNKTIYYSSLDVLELFDGEVDTNVIGFMLGHGMYTRQAGGTPVMRVKIVLDFKDKSLGRYTCVSGQNPILRRNHGDLECLWYGVEGPYVADDPFAGATIDWNKLPHGWDRQSFDPTSAGWTLVPVISSFAHPNAIIKGFAMPPTIDKITFKPVSVKYLSNEYGGPVFIYDIGTNIVGTCEVKVTPKSSAGENVRLRHGEMLLSNGSLNLNYSGHDTGVKAHFQEDVHILPQQASRHNSSISLRSGFVWYGFQYVSVQVSDHGIFDGSLESINCYQMYPDMDSVGNVSFVDDPLSTKQGNIAERLNSVQRIVQISQLGNLAQYAPTDCPTREKHFWLGDALSIAEEAMLNYAVAPLFANFLRIIADEQGHGTKYPLDFPNVVPVVVASKNQQASFKSHQNNQAYGINDVSWTAAFPVILDWMWKHYGDRRIVEEMYDTSKSYVDWLHTEALHQLNSSTVSFYQFGDWCSNQSREIATDSTGPPAAAFNYILAVDAMADMAEVVGHEADSDRYRALGQQLRLEWHSKYYNKHHGLYGYEAEDGFAVQTLSTAPLSMKNVIPDTVIKRVVTNLENDVQSIRKYHQTFGSVGAKHFFTQLSDYGMHDAAIGVATQETFPSFGYWLQQGATSCWENWSGESDDTHPPQPTHNHIFLCGGIGEWMYTHLSGISPPKEPGYKTVTISPMISLQNGPGESRVAFNSPYGSIQSTWKRKLATNENC